MEKNKMIIEDLYDEIGSLKRPISPKIVEEAQEYIRIYGNSPHPALAKACEIINEYTRQQSQKQPYDID